MKIDSSKSLAELTGRDWGPPPETATFQMRERHEIRRKALKKAQLNELRIMLDLDFERDADVLVPYVANRLAALADWTTRDPTLALLSVLKNRRFDWVVTEGLPAIVRGVCQRRLNSLDDEISHAESEENQGATINLLLEQNDILRSLVFWERQCSAT